MADEKTTWTGELCEGWLVVTPRVVGGCYFRELQEIKIWFQKSRNAYEFMGVFYFAPEGSLKLFMKWTDFLRFKRDLQQRISGQRCKLTKITSVVLQVQAQSPHATFYIVLSTITFDSLAFVFPSVNALW